MKPAPFLCRPAFWAAAVVFAFTLFVSWGKYSKEPELSEVKKTIPRLQVLCTTTTRKPYSLPG